MTGMARVRKVVFHWAPHLDEVVAYWLCRKFGEESVFPGIREAEIEFWRGNSSPEGKTWTQYWSDGIVLLGRGGGPFDEHATIDAKRVKDECCATLVAKRLGVQDDPALERILRWTLHNDTKGVAHPFDLGSLTKYLHHIGGPSQRETLFWALMGLEAFYQKEKAFHHDAPSELVEKGVIEEVGRWTMVTIESDNPEMNRFCRSEQGVGAAIVIQKSPTTGHVQMFSDKTTDGLDMNEVARLIRSREADLKGATLPDSVDLAREGSVDGIPEWYYVYGMLLNGSHTAPEVPATRIPLDEFADLVKLAIG